LGAQTLDFTGVTVEIIPAEETVAPNLPADGFEMVLKRGDDESDPIPIPLANITLQSVTPAVRLAAALNYLPNQIEVPFATYMLGATAGLSSTWAANFNDTGTLGINHTNALRNPRLLGAFAGVSATLVPEGAPNKGFRLTVKLANATDIGKYVALAPDGQG
jgi:hypothetical protein